MEWTCRSCISEFQFARLLTECAPHAPEVRTTVTARFRLEIEGGANVFTGLVGEARHSARAEQMQPEIGAAVRHELPQPFDLLLVLPIEHRRDPVSDATRLAIGTTVAEPGAPLHGGTCSLLVLEIHVSLSSLARTLFRFLSFAPLARRDSLLSGPPARVLPVKVRVLAGCSGAAGAPLASLQRPCRACRLPVPCRMGGHGTHAPSSNAPLGLGRDGDIIIIIAAKIGIWLRD